MSTYALPEYNLIRAENLPEAKPLGAGFLTVDVVGAKKLETVVSCEADDDQIRLRYGFAIPPSLVRHGQDQPYSGIGYALQNGQEMIPSVIVDVVVNDGFDYMMADIGLGNVGYRTNVFTDTGLIDRTHQPRPLLDYESSGNTVAKIMGVTDRMPNDDRKLNVGQATAGHSFFMNTVITAEFGADVPFVYVLPKGVPEGIAGDNRCDAKSTSPTPRFSSCPTLHPMSGMPYARFGQSLRYGGKPTPDPTNATMLSEYLTFGHNNLVGMVDQFVAGTAACVGEGVEVVSTNRLNDIYHDSLAGNFAYLADGAFLGRYADTHPGGKLDYDSYLLASLNPNRDAPLRDRARFALAAEIANGNVDALTISDFMDRYPNMQNIAKALDDVPSALANIINSK